MIKRLLIWGSKLKINIHQHHSFTSKYIVACHSPRGSEEVSAALDKGRPKWSSQLIRLRWVSTHSDGGHLILPSLGNINAIYFELVILVSKKSYEWKPSLNTSLSAKPESELAGR